MLEAIYDDHLTGRMRWARRSGVRGGRQYLDMMTSNKNIHTRTIVDLISKTVDDIVQDLEERLDLPTWNVVSMTFKNGYILLEIEEDYRIQEWNRMVGDKYNV